MTRPSSRTLMIGGVVVAVVVLVVLWAVVLPTPSPDAVHQAVESLGWWAPVAALVVYVVAAQFMAPASVLNITCGVGFGFVTGTVVAYLAANVAAWLSFWLTRKLPTAGRKNRADAGAEDGFVSKVAGWVATSPIVAVVILRSIGVAPFGPSNVALGLSPIRARAYVIGSAIGLIPGVVANVTVGAYGLNPTSWQLWVGVAAMVGFAVLGSWWSRRCNNKPAAQAPQQTPRR